MVSKLWGQFSAVSVCINVTLDLNNGIILEDWDTTLKIDDFYHSSHLDLCTHLVFGTRNIVPRKIYLFVGTTEAFTKSKSVYSAILWEQKDGIKAVIFRITLKVVDCIDFYLLLKSFFETLYNRKTSRRVCNMIKYICASDKRTHKHTQKHKQACIHQSSTNEPQNVSIIVKVLKEAYWQYYWSMHAVC